MANKVSFIIDLQDKFSRTAKAVNRQIKGLSRNSAKAARIIKTKLASSFKNLKRIAVGTFVAIAASSVLAFKSIITKGSDFQSSIADLSAITGAAGVNLSKLTDETFRLAKASATAQKTVANAFTQIASSKSELLKDPKALSVVTEQVLLLANASGISVPDAVRASVGALNQFNKSATDAARFVNVIAAGAKVGASLVGETAEALKNFGSVASQFNLSFEEVNSLIQVLAKNEVKAAEAGTALRGTLSRLEKFMDGRLAPSKIGIIKSLEGIEKLGLSNVQIMEAFGDENLRTILILRQNIPLFRQWTKELTGTNIAQQQADIRLAAFRAKARRLGVTINESMIKIFQRLEPMLIRQIELMDKWFGSISTEEITSLSDKLILLLDILLLIPKAILSVVRGFNKIKDFISEDAQLTSELLGKLSFPSRKLIFEGPGSVPARLESAQKVINKTIIEGQIVVTSTEGSKIESTKMKTKGNNLNVGMNMVADNPT